MAARKKDDGGASLRAEKAAERLISRHLPGMLEMLGSAPGQPGMPMVGQMTTVALPVAGAATLLTALRNRPNWYLIARREIDRLARLMVERNWYARGVHRSRVEVYSYGFRFSSEEARNWAASGSYPFGTMQKDMIEEWLVSDVIVAWWRKDAEDGSLPIVNVPNAGDVEYDIIGGIEQITVKIPQKRTISPELKNAIGERLWNCYHKGKALVIPRGDPEFDFRVMRTGKSAAGLPVSSLVTIFDDLDFVEAIKVGDWNGAKARWEIIRHTKKGYGVSSGPNAGTTRNNAKMDDLKAILAAMKKILGKTDVATNFDQDMSWLIFPQEHFHAELLAETRQRLLFWGGIFGVLLLKTDSQITGLSSFMMGRLRAEVLKFREDFSEFLKSIYQSDSFGGKIANMPELIPQWSEEPLYSVEEMNKRVTLLATYGLAAPQWLRDFMGLSEEEQSRLMMEAHDNPKQYAPPYEPRQGISSAFTVPEDTGGNPQETTLPGEPGRPAQS